MKALVLLCGFALCVTSALSASLGTCSTCPTTEPPQPVTRCPLCVNHQCVDDMCNESRYLSHPQNCTKYCVCDIGGAIEMSCPSGLEFNPNTNTCEWPGDFCASIPFEFYPGCSPVTLMPPSYNSRACVTEAPEVVRTCPPCASATCTPSMCDLAVLIPYPGNCSKFCICDSTGAIEADCPPGLVYDPSLNVCNWPELSTCSNDDPYPGCTTTTTISNDPTEPLPCETNPPNPTEWCPSCVNWQCDGSNQMIPYPQNCSRFCACSGNGAIAMNCSSGLVFDAKLGTCVWPHSSSCSNDDPYPGCNAPTVTTTPRPTTSPPSTTPPRPLTRCPECVNSGCTPNMCNQAVAVPYPGDCSKYCVCDTAGAIEMDCPTGLVFDVNLGICNYPEDSSCSNDDTHPFCESP